MNCESIYYLVEGHALSQSSLIVLLFSCSLLVRSSYLFPSFSLRVPATCTNTTINTTHAHTTPGGVYMCCVCVCGCVFLSLSCALVGRFCRVVGGAVPAAAGTAPTAGRLSTSSYQTRLSLSPSTLTRYTLDP